MQILMDGEGGHEIPLDTEPVSMLPSEYPLPGGQATSTQVRPPMCIVCDVWSPWVRAEGSGLAASSHL